MVDRPDDTAAPIDAAATTRIGHAPDTPTTALTLTDQTLQTGCYIEGNSPDHQTALCTNLMAQWAQAGYGFCYVHPDALTTLDILQALPDDRLEDVVWINLRPARLPDQLDIATDQRIALDPIEFDAATIAPEACVTYPSSARVGDYLDVLAHAASNDWNVGSLLANVLDQAVLDDEIDHLDLLQLLHSANYQSSTTDRSGASTLRDWIDEQAAIEWYGSLRRAEQFDPDVFETAYNLLSDATLQGEGHSPLRGTNSCSLHDCVRDDAIILVTGDLPVDDNTGRFHRMRRLGTHLLTTIVVRRVWEGLQSEAPTARDPEFHDRPPIYPVVLDDVTRLCAHEPRLLTELFEHGTTADTPLALVCSGRAPDQFGTDVEAGIIHSLSTRIAFDEQASESTERMLRTDTDVVERSFAAAQQGDIAPPPTCWLKRDHDGLVRSVDDLGGFEPFVPLGPPESSQSHEALEDAITASQRRHGERHPMAGVIDGL